MLLALVLILHIAAFPQSPSRPKPVSAAELEKLAQESVAEKDWDTAADEFRRAVELEPRNPRLRVELAESLSAAQDFPAAIAAFNEALQLDPRNEAAVLGLAEAYRCVFNYDETRKFLERAKQDHPSSSAPRIALGRLEMELHHYDRAIEELQGAIKLAPRDVDARSELAAAYHAKGDLPQTLAQLDIALQRDPANAAESIQKALAARPYNPDYLYLWGKILVKENRGEEALQAFEKITQVNPKESDAFFEIGAIHQQKGDRTQARQAYKKAVDLSPDDPNYRKALESVK
jgi:Flp pilus assembly protein TadD